MWSLRLRRQPRTSNKVPTSPVTSFFSFTLLSVAAVTERTSALIAGSLLASIFSTSFPFSYILVSLHWLSWSRGSTFQEKVYTIVPFSIQLKYIVQYLCLIAIQSLIINCSFHWLNAVFPFLIIPHFLFRVCSWSEIFHSINQCINPFNPKSK